MRRAVYHKVCSVCATNLLKNKDLRPIHLRDFVKMVQYHDLGSLVKFDFKRT